MKKKSQHCGIDAGELADGSVKTIAVPWDDCFREIYENESGDTQTTVERMLRIMDVDYTQIVSIDASTDPIVVKYY